MKRKIEIKPQHLSADMQPSTLNEERRSVELIWTTGAKGLRSPFFGEPYYEELSLDPAHVDMSRLKSGAPLLAVHNDRTLDAVVGVVESASLVGNEGRATVRFARDEQSEKVFQKVKDKIIRNVSVGYSVQEYTQVSKEDEKIPTLRATRWTPMELSLVPIGFDAGAKVRSESKSEKYEVEIINRADCAKEEQMNKDEAQREQSIRAQEKARQAEIRKMVREAGLEEKLADEYIENDSTVESVRTNVALFAKYAKESEDRPDNSIRVEVRQTQTEKRREGFIDALVHRMNPSHKVTDAARQFQGRSLLSMVDFFMGRRLGESDAALATRAMSSSDLPLILANAAEKSAQERYRLSPKSYKQWVSFDTLRNYKPASVVRGGDHPNLLERGEGGEFQYGSFGEEQELVQLKDYGMILAYSSQMLQNDDLKVLRQIAESGGEAAARLDNQLVYSVLTGNPDMGDGNPLFDSAHANLGTPGAISDTTIGEAFQKMREQTSVDGLDILSVPPKWMLVGPQSENLARKYLASIQPSQATNVNPYAGLLELVVDGRITTNDYFFAADSAIIPTVVLYRLEGKESPEISSRVNWATGAVEFKTDYAAVAAAVDWRGMFKNANAS
jgi:hypothetical protein